MPSRWLITLPGIPPAALPPEHLHAVVSGWFDTTPAEHRSAAKPYSLTPPEPTPDGARIEVAILDDELAVRLQANAAPGARHRFGSTWIQLDRPPRQVAGLAWDAPAEDATAWSLRFLTPTTFRRGNSCSPNPSLRAILGSLRRTWRDFAPPSAPPIVLDLAPEPLWLTDIEVTSHVTRLNQRMVSGFTGRLRFTTDASDQLTTAVSRLVALAEFAGVGAYTTHGFGVTRTEPTRNPRRGTTKHRDDTTRTQHSRHGRTPVR